MSGGFLQSDDNAINIDNIDLDLDKLIETVVSGNDILSEIEAKVSTSELQVSGNIILNEIETTLLQTQDINVSGNNILLSIENINLSGVSVLNSINTNLGNQNDLPASSDTGSFSLISFIKRGLENWTSLLARIPILVSGRIPIDGSGVIQPVSGSISVDNFPTSTAGLTNDELRASPVPVSIDDLNITIPSGTSFQIDLSDTNTLLATGNDIVSKIDINLGQQLDSPAANNFGSFSLIALFKRLLEKLDFIVNSISIFGGTLDSGFTLDYLFQNMATSNLQVSGIDVLNSIDTKLDLMSASGINIKSFKNYRGKEVTVSGSNIVNDIKVNYSELFFYDIVQDIWLEFPENIQVSFTSDDNIDTDYRTILSEKSLNIKGISISNIKIKSQNLQTGFIYTAGF